MAFKKKNSLLACVSALAVAGALALGGCSASGHTGGVAATVNGTDIAEDTVTEYVEGFRAAQGLDTEDAWAEWLNSSGMTSADVRDTVLDTYVKEELEKQLAKDNDVTVDDSAIDSQVESIKANYSTDDEWNQALKAQGFTDEQQYRDSIRMSMLEQGLADKVVTEDDDKVKDSDLVSYLGMYASSYDGMKRSSHILFAADDKDTAKKVLADLKNGKISWNDAVAKYSTDEGSKENHGDVGWDKMTSFVEEYTDGLDKLDKGEMSGLVESDYGFHIIKCTDVFNSPKKITKASQCPDELVDTVRQYLENQQKSSAYDKWYEEQEKKADIHKNDIPTGVSYYIDLDAYNKNKDDEGSDASDEGSDEESDDSSQDASNEDGNTDESGSGDKDDNK